MAKECFLKVYSISGKYITTWNDASFDSFPQTINGGLGSCEVELARKFDDFGEGADVKFMNEVQIWVVDGDTGVAGKCMYSGYISNISPFIDGHNEGVKLTLLGYVTHLKNYPLIGASENSVAFISHDCSTIMKDIIDNYRAFHPYTNKPKSGFHRINYSSGSTGSISDNTLAVLSYTFANINILDALEKIRLFAPENWWWFIGADNLLQFKRKPPKATHHLTFEKDFRKVDVAKNIESMINHVKFWNGKQSFESDYLLQNYKDPTSQNDHLLWYSEKTDSRVKVLATANLFGNTLLAEKKDPIVQTKIEVIDNNYAEDGMAGYDIESLQVGHTVKLQGFNDNTSNTFEENMTISQIQYSLDKAIITLDNKQVEAGRQISQIQAQLDDTINSDAP